MVAGAGDGFAVGRVLTLLGDELRAKRSSRILIEFWRFHLVPSCKVFVFLRQNQETVGINIGCTVREKKKKCEEDKREECSNVNMVWLFERIEREMWGGLFAFEGGQPDS